MGATNHGRVAVALVVAAGVAGSAARADEPTLIAEEFLPARLAGHVYVNARTGERVMTGGVRPRMGTLFWQNDDIAGDSSLGASFFTGFDRPTRDTASTGRVKFGGAGVCWGDIADGSRVDGYEVAYSTDIGPDPAGAGVAGLDMITCFLSDYDGGLGPGGVDVYGLVHAVVVTALRLRDLAGAADTPPSVYPTWIYTVDLEGSGLEFVLSGLDLDRDGLHDFAYSYEFVQGQAMAKGVIGPWLVRPFSLGGTGSATGCVDAFDWFNQLSGPSTFSDYLGAFWFGDHVYASLYMNLYGRAGWDCARVDYTQDGLVDFCDYLEFLSCYDGRDATADLNGDGQVDFADYLEFLNLYNACA